MSAAEKPYVDDSGLNTDQLVSQPGHNVDCARFSDVGKQSRQLSLMAFRTMPFHWPRWRHTESAAH